MGIASAEKPRRTGIEDVVVAVTIEQPACGQVRINGFAVIFRIEWSLRISAMINKRRGLPKRSPYSLLMPMSHPLPARQL